MRSGSTRSTRRATAALCVVGALAPLIGPAPADAAGKRVRVFAMGPKLDIGWMQSRETFRAKMFALMDRRMRGAGAPLVQAGADDAASHLRGPADPANPVATARDLVAWPEDIGLFAAFTGPQGSSARSSPSLVAAVASLAGPYAGPLSRYTSRDPALASRPPPGRALVLALTDVFARVAVETFAEMADRYDVYLEAGVTMARDWQIVCEDRAAFNSARPARVPGGARCERQDPGAVAALRDPFEPARDYAYEAVGSDAAVMALVFDPDGRLISRQVKTYLTPLELGPAEEQVGLDLVPGRVSDGLSPLRTPVGTLGFVTSKDAWMPDVLSKLDQGRVDLLIQPEFFIGNLVGGPGMWDPDVLLSSGYSDVLRHPSIEAMVLPELVGNFGDGSADHQSHIAVKPRRVGGPAGFMVGQPPAPGLAPVLGWVVPDPARADEPFPERRRRLGEAGARLQPGSGAACPDPARPGPCENGHVEGVIFRDVTVGRRVRFRRFRGRRARTRFSASRPVRRSRRPQRNAAVAMRGRRGVIAFEERRRGRDQILLVHTRDGGRTWSRPVRPTGRPRRATDEWWPAVALGGRGRVTLAWVDRSSGRHRVYVVRSLSGGRRFGRPRPLDAAAPPSAAQLKPALAQGRGDQVHVAFIDERDAFADGGAPQAGLRYARILRGVPQVSRRLDSPGPRPLAARLDNSWAPSVAARGGRVLVTWLDFRNYDWDVFSRESGDDGKSFGAERQVNDTPSDQGAGDGENEALNDTPRAAFTSGGPIVAFTDWRKRASAETQPHSLYDTYVATPGGRNRQVDQHGARQVSTFSPAVCASGEDLLVAFQDASRGQNDVFVTRVRGGSERGRARRVDDAGRRGGNAWRPQLGCAAGRVLAAWEDERDGPPQIYFARTRAARLR